MNKHILIDNLTANIGVLVPGSKKFFAESTESLSFEELIKSTEISVPEINSEGTYEIRATSKISGELDPAFRVEKWLGIDHPSIIYHRGNNERPFDYRKRAKNSFMDIFLKARDKFDANLIAVRAPFHNGRLKQYQQKMMHLINFMAMIAASVKLNESIIEKLREISNAPVITCGISLGGWVTNLHRSYYNSSTVYVPLLAGTFLGELFLKSKYRKLSSDRVFQEPEKIRQLLNFNEDFIKVTDGNVYPLLAIYDRYIATILCISPAESLTFERNSAFFPVGAIDKINLLGVSMGGVIALHFAVMHQSKVKSLMVADTFAKVSSAMEKTIAKSQVLGFRIFKFLPSSMAAGLVSSAYKKVSKDAESYFREVTISADFGQLVLARKAINKINVIDQLKNINVPSLVIVGDKVKFMIPVNRKIADAIPRSEFHIIRNSMDPSNMVAPELFNQLVSDFLNYIQSNDVQGR